MNWAAVEDPHHGSAPCETLGRRNSTPFAGRPDCGRGAGVPKTKTERRWFLMNWVLHVMRVFCWATLLLSVGCPTCPEGQSKHRTGWSTSELNTTYFSIPGDFGHYYCFTGTTKSLLRQCSWSGDKNFPSRVNCHQEGLSDPVAFGAIAKMRLLMDCDYVQKGLEVRWFDEDTGSAVSDGQIRDTLDTGVIDIRGILCFRNTVNTTAIAEYYFPDFACGAPETPDSDEVFGGRAQSCAIPRCSDGSYCPLPNACHTCQYATLCLPPGQTCQGSCGSQQCDRSASCLACPSQTSPTYFCAKPTQVCCATFGVCDL